MTFEEEMVKCGAKLDDPEVRALAKAVWKCGKLAGLQKAMEIVSETFYRHRESRGPLGQVAKSLEKAAESCVEGADAESRFPGKI